MTHHASADPHRVPPKTKDSGTAHTQAGHERRHKSVESKYGVIGAGCTVVGVVAQTTAASGNPANYFPGIVYDATGLRAYNSGGVITMQILAADGSISVFGSGTITGSLIQTSVGNPRIVLDGQSGTPGLRVYNSVGTAVMNADLNSNTITFGTTTTVTGGVFQTASSGQRVVMDGSGVRAYDASLVNTVNIDNTGAFTLTKAGATIQANASGVTIASVSPGATGARVTIDATGIKGFNASNVQQFLLDATSGLITCTGVITANAGSAIPTATITGYLPAGANRYSNSAFQNGASIFDQTGWTVSNAASSGSTTITPVYGALTMKLIASAAGHVYVAPVAATDAYRRVLPGISYTFSHYVYPTTVARQSTINVQWYDSSGAALSSSSGVFISTVLNQYTRIAQTFTAPANAAYAQAIHYVGLSSATSDVCYVECLQMEEGDRVSAWSPRADEILVNQINAVNINVANLAAINANLGAITAGSLNAVTVTSSTITGSTIQTASANPKTAMDSTGLFVTNSGGAKLIGIDAAGGISLSTGTGVLNQVIWHDTNTGGAAVGKIGTSIGSSSAALDIELDALGSGAPSHLTFQQALAGVGDSLSAVIRNAAQTVQYNTWFMRGDGTSDFMQLVDIAGGASPVPSRAWSGAVNANGTKRLNGLGNWSVVRNSAGNYTLTLSGGVSSVWGIPTVQTNEQQGSVSRVDYISLSGTTSVFNVLLYSGPFSFGIADANWSFHAIASAN